MKGKTRLQVMKNAEETFIGNLKGRDHLGYIRVDNGAI
jgi:hypothetical protein